MRLKIFTSAVLFMLLSGSMYAQNKNYGSISGSVLDSLTAQPLEFVNVAVINPAQGNVVTGAVSGKGGEFVIDNIPFGKYVIRFSYIGYRPKELNNLIIDTQHKKINVGKYLLNNTGVTLNETVVTSDKIMLNNSIDRKVYNVEKDILSSTGTASDLLQNIPSVQVDIEGNVSLRGSADVMILINGSPSPLMGKTKAEVLRQMPASSIEKIEVITNPSAKYKPDGTSGIINIVMKKDVNAGLNGSVSLNAGNNNRYNGNVSLNYRPGKLNLFGSISLRKDERNGFSSDVRTQFDSAGKTSGYYFSETGEKSKLFSASFTLGADYNLDDANSFGLSGNFFNRDKDDTALIIYLLSNENRTTTADYDRTQFENELEKEYGLTAYYEHKFAGDDHKLRVQFNSSISPEEEDNHYINKYRIPSITDTFEHTFAKNKESENLLEVQYSNQLTDKSTFEAGYLGEFDKADLDYLSEYFDPVVNSFVTDQVKTNHFVFNETIHAAYTTYSNTFGQFGILAGLRAEGAFIKSNLISANQIIKNEYYDIYPTLHLSYKLNEMLQLQLNYSKRAHRPEGDDLNPFPDYEDPRNIRAGNPNLKPEYTHSMEFGIQWTNKLFTIIPSVFYRNRYNAMTSVTKAINDSTLLTTKENLATDKSAGFELVLSGGYDFFTVNMSTMAFFETIDASNLGYENDKSTTTWSGNLSCNLNLPASFMLQINSNYRSRRLTPQGEYDPSFVLNLGLRKDIFDDRVTLIMTISDLFNSLNRKLRFDTQWLKQNTYSTRDAKIFYFGITYHLGKKDKREKDLQYDNAL